MEYYRQGALLFQAKSPRGAENQGAEMFRHTGRHDSSCVRHALSNTAALSYLVVT